MTIKFGHPEGPGESPAPLPCIYGVFKALSKAWVGQDEIQLFPHRNWAISCRWPSRFQGPSWDQRGQNAGWCGFASSMNILEMPYSIKNTEVGREVLWVPLAKNSLMIWLQSQHQDPLLCPKCLQAFYQQQEGDSFACWYEGDENASDWGPYPCEMVKALGASPTPYPGGTLQCPSNRVADGQENPALPSSWVSFMKYRSSWPLTDTSWIPHWLSWMINSIKASRRMTNGLSTTLPGRPVCDGGDDQAKEAYDIQAIQKAGMTLYYPRQPRFNSSCRQQKSLCWRWWAEGWKEVDR